MPTRDMATKQKRGQEWQPKHLAEALDELRRHCEACPVCRTWQPMFHKNPHCNNLRLTVNRVMFLWSNVPAGSRHRQLQMFGDFQAEREEDNPPY